MRVLAWYAAIGLAYSLLNAWRCGNQGKPLWKDIFFSLLSGAFWPWAMLSIERHLL